MCEQILTGTDEDLLNYSLLDHRLLAILQISNGTFPVGGFSHSYGIETYVQDNKVKNVDEVKEIISGMIRFSMANCDGPAARLAYLAAANGDLNRLKEIDRFISAIKAVREIREASLKTGKAMLRLTEVMFTDEVIKDFHKFVKDSGGGHFSVVFGMVCGCLKIGEWSTILAFIYTSVSSLLSVATKLVPLGVTESQKAMVDLYPLILHSAQECMNVSLEEIRSFTPGLDIAGMKHERLYTRLYMS